jgi:hypothetical protein
MRVALLASSFMLLAGSPAFAQCVYVACGGTQTAPPVVAAPLQTNSYEQGYAAGLAARPATGTVVRTVVRQLSPAPKARTAHRAPTRVLKAPAVRHAVTTRPAARPATRNVSRTHIVRRTTSVAAPRRTHNVVTTHTRSYNDPIKNRAQTYQATSYGSATSMASLMSQSSSYSSSYTSSSAVSGVSWVGPGAVTSQNGQTCGWGARIVTNSHGQAQRQAMWVCQCPQGWRPPGY